MCNASSIRASDTPHSLSFLLSPKPPLALPALKRHTIHSQCSAIENTADSSVMKLLAFMLAVMGVAPSSANLYPFGNWRLIDPAQRKPLSPLPLFEPTLELCSEQCAYLRPMQAVLTLPPNIASPLRVPRTVGYYTYEHSWLKGPSSSMESRYCTCLIRQDLSKEHFF